MGSRVTGRVVAGIIFSGIWDALRWTWHETDGYAIISGPLAGAPLVGGAYAIYRRHNCHAKGCWRIGRHKVGGTECIVCRKHQPRDSRTAEQIREEHHAALGALNLPRDRSSR